MTYFFLKQPKKDYFFQLLFNNDIDLPFFQMFFQMNKEIKIWHTYLNKLVPLNRDRFTIN